MPAYSPLHSSTPNWQKQRDMHQSLRAPLSSLPGNTCSGHCYEGVQLSQALLNIFQENMHFLFLICNVCSDSKFPPSDFPHEEITEAKVSIRYPTWDYGKGSPPPPSRGLVDLQGRLSPICLLHSLWHKALERIPFLPLQRLKTSN